MLLILCIIGSVWFTGAVLFTFALAAAAKRPMRLAHDDITILEHAA